MELHLEEDDEVVSPQTQKRIAGRGMPLSKRENEFGDLIVCFEVVFPAKMSKDRKHKIAGIILENNLNSNLETEIISDTKTKQVSDQNMSLAPEQPTTSVLDQTAANADQNPNTVSDTNATTPGFTGINSVNGLDTSSAQLAGQNATPVTLELENPVSLNPITTDKSNPSTVITTSTSLEPEKMSINLDQESSSDASNQKKLAAAANETQSFAAGENNIKTDHETKPEFEVCNSEKTD